MNMNRCSSMPDRSCPNPISKNSCSPRSRTPWRRRTPYENTAAHPEPRRQPGGALPAHAVARAGGIRSRRGVARPLEELQGMPPFDVTHPEDVEHCQTLFGHLVRDGMPFDTDKRYLRQDGLVVWTSNSISVVRDKNGVAQHAIAIVIDITERK